MKYYLGCILALCTFFTNAQDKKNPFTLDANYFYGTVLEHNPDIAHLITDHPTGVILGFNQKTFGNKAWESRYNYPDYGASFIYQDMKNYHLGENYGLYAHFNFYFLNRNLKFRIGQGIAYATNPYDKVENFRNNAYGSDLLSSTYVMLNYDKQNIFKGFGLQAGISIIHYSNANFKAPNNSTNTFAFNIGANYTLDYDNQPDYIASTEDKNSPKKLNITLHLEVELMKVILMILANFLFIFYPFMQINV